MTVANAAANVKLPHAHPHMLRRLCGFYLYSKGNNSRLIQDYLEQLSSASTKIYIEYAALAMLIAQLVANH